MVQDQMVGQTKDDEACGRKPSIATAVAQRPWEMRSTVGFDDEACLLAEEVHDKGSDGMLTSTCTIIGGETQKVASPSRFPAPLSVPERGWG
jgi:hypothetical protein